MRIQGMNANQKDTLATCLTQVFGRVEDSFLEAVIPLVEWIELAAGQTLFRQNDSENGVYFMISGRLRVTVEVDGEQRTINEVARGETVGEMAVLTGEPRSATVTAIRDSVLAYASREVFEDLMRQHPELPIHMSRIIISRLKRSGKRHPSQPATICLLAVTDGVDARSFGEQLVQELDRWGVATLETSSRIDERFGDGASQSVGTAAESPTSEEAAMAQRVTLWLDDVEFWNELVVLATDGADTPWTRRCLRHADRILLLARADAPVAVSALEASLCSGPDAITGGRQTLVLLHDAECPHPEGTVAWLDRRPVDDHLHVRPDMPRDMARLARVVSGNGIGLVLGGGGARGFAHLGVYQALEEAGIEVDFLVGTSIGSVMAAWISFGIPAEELVEHARRAFARNPTGDYAVPPLISLVRGGRLRRTIDGAVRRAVGASADVVDSWRTLRCVATNLSRAREEVLGRGPVARCVRASVSIPVALPPVAWDGDLLIDGGVFNNFPTDVAGDLGARRIIGVDLSRTRRRSFEHDEVPGPFELFLDRFRGRRRRYRLPSLGSVLMNTTVLYSESRREEARRAVDIYVNPDLGGIPLLDWGAFDRTIRIGYESAREVLAEMSEEQLAPYRNRPTEAPAG